MSYNNFAKIVIVKTRISYLQTCDHTTYKETGRDDVFETLHY